MNVSPRRQKYDNDPGTARRQVKDPIIFTLRHAENNFWDVEQGLLSKNGRT